MVLCVHKPVREWQSCGEVRGYRCCRCRVSCCRTKFSKVRQKAKLLIILRGDVNIMLFITARGLVQVSAGFLRNKRMTAQGFKKKHVFLRHVLSQQTVWDPVLSVFNTVCLVQLAISSRLLSPRAPLVEGEWDRGRAGAIETYDSAKWNSPVRGGSSNLLMLSLCRKQARKEAVIMWKKKQLNVFVTINQTAATCSLETGFRFTENLTVIYESFTDWRDVRIKGHMLLQTLMFHLKSFLQYDK